MEIDLGKGDLYLDLISYVNMWSFEDLKRLEESGNQALAILRSPGKSFGAKNIDQQLRSAVVSACWGSPVAKNFPKVRRHERNTRKGRNQ